LPWCRSQFPGSLPAFNKRCGETSAAGAGWAPSPTSTVQARAAARTDSCKETIKDSSLFISPRSLLAHAVVVSENVFAPSALL
jgi:hypothetical protein